MPWCCLDTRTFHTASSQTETMTSRDYIDLHQRETSCLQLACTPILRVWGVVCCAVLCCAVLCCVRRMVVQRTNSVRTMVAETMHPCLPAVAFFSHLKYRCPFTLPLFLPTGSSSSIPMRCLLGWSGGWSTRGPLVRSGRWSTSHVDGNTREREEARARTGVQTYVSLLCSQD